MIKTGGFACRRVQSNEAKHEQKSCYRQKGNQRNCSVYSRVNVFRGIPRRNLQSSNDAVDRFENPRAAKPAADSGECKADFAAVHQSVSGPSRHLVQCSDMSEVGSEADMRG